MFPASFSTNEGEGGNSVAGVVGSSASNPPLEMSS